jgi:hypothetical protein
MKAAIITSIAMAIALASLSKAHADFTSGQIDVDFGSPGVVVGPAVLGSAGDVWNQDTNASAHTTGVLLLTSGVQSTGVTLSLGTAIGVGTLVFQGPFTGTPYSGLMSAGRVENASDQLIISGLTPLQAYELYFYSDVTGADSRWTGFTVNGDTRYAVNTLGFRTFVEENNFVYFPSESADSDGRLSIAISRSQVTSVPDPVVNGFQIIPVPEPSSFELCALSVAGLVVPWRVGRGGRSER